MTPAVIAFEKWLKEFKKNYADTRILEDPDALVKQAWLAALNYEHQVQKTHEWILDKHADSEGAEFHK